ncbi:complement C1q and tumor necrosis factor-related protein 9-like [Antennarius striatus]|uniref:complement C1q and tumor necrosis factor-related protein 9-like n=1 Tax=Antennarius striatus TaxID=241820 RepID=UPI0035B4C4C6
METFLSSLPHPHPQALSHGPAAMMGRHTTKSAQTQTVDSTPESDMSNKGELVPMVSNSNSGMRSFHTSDPSMGNVHDMAMCDLLMNGDVPTPIDQIPVYCLCSHCQGNVGPKGERGDRGHPGTPGSPGRRGLTGFRGLPGFTGSPGIKGQKGDLGDKGQTGKSGYIGAKGGRGYKGEKGDRGMLGFAGVPGPQGEAGTCPASCDNAHGPPGPKGPPGTPGARGLPGIPGKMGPEGYMGDKGDMGLTGDPGMMGKKGDQGEQGLCECTNGEHGTDGAKGEQGVKGDKGGTGENGPGGALGPKGDKGNMGHIGLPGPCSPAIQSAFSACIVEPFPAPNYPVAFPKVITNMQGHFNPDLGMYTAPVNGTYSLAFHLAVSSKVLKVGMFLNFRPVVINTETTHQATSSQTVILHLYRGDRVWLQVKDTTTNGMYTDSESASTFSGYLLYPDTCDLPERRTFLVSFDPSSTDSSETETFEWKDLENTDNSP